MVSPLQNVLEFFNSTQPLTTPAFNSLSFIGTCISLLILVVSIGTYILYYYFLGSDSFYNRLSWFLAGGMSALILGIMAFFWMKDHLLGLAPPVLNNKSLSVYDTLISISRDTGLLTAGLCLAIYLFLSLFYTLRKNRYCKYPDVPFTPRSKR